LPGTDPGHLPGPFPPGTTERTLPVGEVSLHLIATAGAPARPGLFLVPGYTDHAGRYGEAFRYFHDRGHAVWAMDPRGHGASSGPRGFVPRFERYLDDLGVALSVAQAEAPAAGWVLLGHSTGGLMVLAALQERGAAAPFDAVAGVVVTCPLLRLKRRTPLWQLGVAAVATRLMPCLSLPVLAPYVHSHDPEQVRLRAADPLIFHSVNARWYEEVRAAAARVVARPEALGLPVLGLQAGIDPVVDAGAARAFFARCPRGRYVEYPGMYHEILLEQDRARVYRDIALWLDALG
jgi:alpha-beta hydrolase superfamily lysophospholipase